MHDFETKTLWFFINLYIISLPTYWYSHYEFWMATLFTVYVLTKKLSSPFIRNKRDSFCEMPRNKKKYKNRLCTFFLAKLLMLDNSQPCHLSSNSFKSATSHSPAPPPQKKRRKKEREKSTDERNVGNKKIFLGWYFFMKSQSTKII